MEDKQTKKIKRYLEDAIDEKNEILLSTNILIETASHQVQALLNVHSTLGQKEAVLRYLAKTVALFSELNFSVLQFLESESLPFQTENVQSPNEIQSQDLNSPDIQSVCNLVKTSDSFAQTSFNSSRNESPTVANIVQDNLNEVLIINGVPEPIPNSTTNHSSPPFLLIGELEVSSVAYQHPLTKFQVPTDIPKQYDTQDLDKIKESSKFLSKKMGFDSDQFGKIQSHYHKSVPRPNFEYEEPDVVKNDNGDAPPVKRGRGRPKGTTKKQTAKTNGTTAGKGRRGRPKKEEKREDSSAEEENGKSSANEEDEDDE